jgi:hypothetical protein
MELSQQPKSPSTTNNTRRRVKVYQLGDKGEWEDKGTGHVTCSFIEVMCLSTLALDHML